MVGLFFFQIWESRTTSSNTSYTNRTYHAAWSMDITYESSGGLSYYKDATWNSCTPYCCINGVWQQVNMYHLNNELSWELADGGSSPNYWYTPIMTSATSNSCTITASSYAGNTYLPWKAFNNFYRSASDAWASKASDAAPWIQIALPTSIRITDVVVKIDTYIVGAFAAECVPLSGTVEFYESPDDVADELWHKAVWYERETGESQVLNSTLVYQSEGEGEILPVNVIRITINRDSDINADTYYGISNIRICGKIV